MSGQECWQPHWLAVHVAKNEIKRDEAEVTCREEQWMKQEINKSLMIKAHDNTLNKDVGVSIDTNWNPPSSYM